MQQIPERAIVNWISIGANQYRPRVIDWHCPNCARSVAFTAPDWQAIGNANNKAESHCPACQVPVTFFAMRVGTGPNSLTGGSLYIYPPAKQRAPSAEILESPTLPPILKAEYESAMSTLALKKWVPTAVTCRRLLEGIAQNKLPPEHHNKTLYQQLQELPAHLDLEKPILDLAAAIRTGGNLGAHFSSTRQPTEKVAHAMLELIEDLLKYLFTLPVRIQELQSEINAPAPPGTSDVPGTP